MHSISSFRVLGVVAICQH